MEHEEVVVLEDQAEEVVEFEEDVDNQVHWVEDEEVVVQAEEVGLAKAKVLDALQAEEQRVDEVNLADEVRED